MQLHRYAFLLTRYLTTLILCLSFFPPVLALDPNSGVQQRRSSPDSRQSIAPSQGTPKVPPHSGRNISTKTQPTTEQLLSSMSAKLATLEHTVSLLQNQVSAQTQQIAQLKQIISINSSGTVTIQAPGTLKFTAGGTLDVSASMVDVKAAIAGFHGMLKGDTMMTNTIIAQTYTPGAGNIW